MTRALHPSRTLRRPPAAPASDGAQPSGADAGAPVTEAALRERYDTLRRRSEWSPEHASALVALAREARQAGFGALARQALASASVGFSACGQFARGTAAVELCAQLARADGDAADEARARLAKARVLQAAGEHDASFRTLLDLLKPATLSAMHPSLRFEVFGLLAEQCAPVDPGDSVDLCLTLAERECQAQGQPPPAHFACSRIGYLIDRYLWSDPVFATLLRPLHMTPAERAALLARLQREVRELHRHPSLDKSPLVQLAAGLVADIVRSLAGDGAAPVLAASERLGAAQVRNAQFLIEFRYQFAATLLLLGHPALAERTLGALAQVDGRFEGATLERQLMLTHLRSMTALARGETDRARQLYQAYAQGMARHMLQMNLHVRELLLALTRLPGGRPGDSIEQRPAYLTRALGLLAGTAEEPMGVGELARAVGVSERTLREAFAVHLGMSPKQYAIASRLDAVRDFLQSGAARGASLRDLAERFGFSNPARFARLYRERFGQAPMLPPPAG